MQKLILIVLIPFFSMFWSPGGDDLDKMLKEAQQLEQQRKYKSAVDMAVKVQDLARKEQNDIVFIQALELEIKAQRWFGYETFNMALDRIDKALEKPFGRTEILLHAFKISGYNQYYTQNSYQLRDNLNDGIINEEPKQWSKHDIWKLIDTEVHKILGADGNQELNKDELKKLTFSKQVDGVQPTNIKDLAILTAIENMKHFDGDFPFKSDNLYAEKSVFVDSFKKQTVEHPTEIVASYYALLLENMQSEGLLADYLNLMRLNDLFKLDDQYNKLKMYENALEKIASTNSPVKTSATAKLAEIYNGYASQYKDQEKINEAINWQNKAIQVCEEALKAFPESDGAKSCKLFVEQVMNPTVNVSLQAFLMAEKPVPVRIAYKNTNWVKLKLYRTNAEDFVKSQRHRGVLMEKKLPLVWEQKIDVPQYNDFFQHDVITMLPKVEKGFYLLRAETDKLSEGDRDNYEFLNVTNMAIVSSPVDDATNYQLVNRVSGENLTQGQAEIVKINYDYRTKQQNITYDLPRKMNEGKLVLPRKTRGNYLQFTKGEDTLVVRFNYNVKYNRIDKERKNVQIITDRSIYRPGQVVHFKAILTNEKEDDYKPVSDEKLQINLIGSNHKQISQRVLSTNEYGSVYGTFPIPENARPGNFRLQTQYGSAFFDVQYYKRPIFEAEYVTGDKLVKPGEEVELDLQVNSFAGSPIQGAVVETTVKIGASFFRYWPGFNNSQVVDYAVDTTNNVGIASIKFKSLPANDMQYYSITSKVTLPDGASNEFNHSYYVTNKPLNINEILWYNKLWYSEIENEKIPVTGINGEKIKEDIVLKVKSLDYSGKYFYSMPFSTAEKMLVKEDLWQDHFPGMAYNDKLDPSKLERKKTVLETTSKDGFFVLNDDYKLNEGWYAFEFYAADTLNKTIYIKTFDPDYKKIKIPDPLTVHIDKGEVLPGEKINITLSSKFEDAKIHLLVNNNKDIMLNQIYEIDGKKKQIELPISNDIEGNISISGVLISDGREFSVESSFKVIPVKRKISIEFTSIRDKITPGDDERWSLKLTKEGEAISNAEIVAGMYDMSLDMFVVHKWNFPYQNVSYLTLMLQASGFMNGSISQFKPIEKSYENSLQWYLNSPFSAGVRYRNGMRPMIEGAKAERTSMTMELTVDNEEAPLEQVDEFVGQDKVKTGESINENKKNENFSVRTNFNETAFFYPTLKTNNEGKANIQFSAPQSMTKWKLQVFAHDKEMASGYAKHEVLTQKKLMVIPNRLRFVHQGDKVELKALVYNLTDEEIQVRPDIRITNPYNGERIKASTKMRSINVAPKGNGSFTVEFEVPEGLNALTYQIAGVAGEHTDGELHNIPVLPSRQRIINTLVFWNKPNQTKKYKFASIDKLESETAKIHELTIELSTNPVWHAIKAMPAVFESNNQSAIQLARNFQITAWGDYLIQQNPEIERVFKVWKDGQSKELTSALNQKEELRNLLIGETPWEEVAANEELQHAALMEMLNTNFVDSKMNEAINKLNEQQLENGAFSWRPGMRASFYFTLQSVMVLSETIELQSFKEYGVQNIMSKALNYLKGEIDTRYYKLMHYSADTTKYSTPVSIIQYLVAQKQLNNNYKITSEAEKFYYNHAFDYKKMNLYQMALSGILAIHYGNTDYAKLVVDRLKERATVDSEKGMFWRENQFGWSWDEAPMQTQAMIAQFFKKMKLPNSELDAIKLWMVHEKQGQAWRNTDASLAAVRTLINTGSDWVNEKNAVTIKLGGLTIDSEKEAKTAGTGYFSKKIDKIDKSMKDITIQNDGKTPVWGGIYHSFTERFENIKSNTDELSVERQIFIKKKTAKGETVVPYDPEKDKLKVGDEVRVQLIIKSKRALDYVWVKAPHGACFEPKDQMSGYKWDSGKSYYVESHDIEKRFFFDYLNNENIVIAYDLYVERNGQFNAGPVEIQSAYAPEFSAHTAGIRTIVEE